jgi:hypothetical protein
MRAITRLNRINDRTSLALAVIEQEDLIVDLLEKAKVIEFNEDLDKGTALIKGICSVEPQSPEEIEKALKIDKKKWKLSQYWNKQKADHWVVSALVTRVAETPQDTLAQTISGFTPTTIHRIPAPVFNPNFQEPVAGVISMQDLHYGKGGNEKVTALFKTCLQDLVFKSYHSHHLENLYFVLGGDLLNMDTFSGTTTSGTPVENGQTAPDAYNTAFEDMYWAIGFLKQFCKKLVVVYVPGNHDRLSSYHLVHGLSKCFHEDESIDFDFKYEERKVHVYGNCFFGFEHGDVKSKNPVALFASEFPTKWGATLHRTIFTGHTHTKRTRDVITENEIHGLSIKEMPSLSATDYWHYHNKYTGNRKAGVIELHSKTKGKISEFFHISA